MIKSRSQAKNLISSTHQRDSALTQTLFTAVLKVFNSAVISAEWLSALSVLSIFRMACKSGALIILAPRASMSTNAQVRSVSILMSATSSYKAFAYIGRLKLRALGLSAFSTKFAATGMIFFNDKPSQTSISTGFSLQVAEWIGLIVIPPIYSILGLFGTRHAARSVLGGLT